MKHKYEIIAIVICWISFLVWEYYVQQWINVKNDPIVRVDLIIILPALAMITLWEVFRIKKGK